MTSAQYWSLVTEVLLTGPADGQEILTHAQTNNLWEALYLASRSSPHASVWREAFGRQSVSQPGAKSILELGVQMLIDQADTLTQEHPSEQDRIQTTQLLARLIANCSADNDHNRRLVIRAGGLLPLIKSLVDGADPNVFVPAIYNVCADLDDPADQVIASGSDPKDEVRITLAEERLARTDVPSNGIYSGIVALLSPGIVASCDNDILEYLADLVEMSARPAAAAQEGLADPRDGDFGFPLERLLAAASGGKLAEYSARCRCSVARSLLAISISRGAKTFLASTGMVFAVAQMAASHSEGPKYYGEDDQEQQENREALKSIQEAMSKLVYEVCQLPEFVDPPKYGIARHSLNIIRNTYEATAFTKTVAYTVLYGFVDNDIRAGLLVSEELLPSLIETLMHEIEKAVIHPALGLTTKLVVTWSLKAQVYRAGVLPAVKRFLTAANLGYEIPLNTITFLELLMKGHPEHVAAMLQPIDATSIMDDVFLLFNKGQEAICLEIGRFVVEVCATLGQQNVSPAVEADLSLEQFISSCGTEVLAQVLVFMGTKAQSEVPAIAQAVWFALGLLSTCPSGKQVVLFALQDTEMQGKVIEIEAGAESWLSGNVKFMLHNIGGSLPQTNDGSITRLDGSMARMSMD